VLQSGALLHCVLVYFWIALDNYYQWGRDADGHEKITSANATARATSLTFAGDKFIVSSKSRDWTDFDINGTLRSANWSKIDGSSICPVGFRVPTIDELKAETIDLTGSNKVEVLADAYNGFLKISGTGFRGNNTRTLIVGIGYSGFLWSASVDGEGAYSMNFHIADALLVSNDTRYNGYPVRCIKE